MSYALFVDKPITFECKIELDGASLTETSARLVIERGNHHIMFEGTVNSHGVCTIPVSKMRGLLDEDATGSMRLEVIAEDTFFQPWESDFHVESAKKMTVEVKQAIPETKPALRVEVKQPTPRDPKEAVTRAIVSELRLRGITPVSAIQHKGTVRSVIQEHLSRHNLNDDLNTFIPTVVKLLAK
jgi:hypothetical protein